jgi:hypothetical protein
MTSDLSSRQSKSTTSAALSSLAFRTRNVQQKSTRYIPISRIMSPRKRNLSYPVVPILLVHFHRHHHSNIPHHPYKHFSAHFTLFFPGLEAALKDIQALSTLFSSISLSKAWSSHFARHTKHSKSLASYIILYMSVFIDLHNCNASPSFCQSLMVSVPSKIERLVSAHRQRVIRSWPSFASSFWSSSSRPLNR